jgi:hypothetical protein
VNVRPNKDKVIRDLRILLNGELLDFYCPSYIVSGQIKVDDMGGTCSTCERDRKT